jgi:hypothetical protein
MATAATALISAVLSAVPTRSLPPLISAARLAIQDWPTDAAELRPLFYLPLEHLQKARLSSGAPLRPEAQAIASDVNAAIESLGGSDHAKVAVALLMLAGGGADECHALVTPLSWPDGTTFGGPPVYGSEAASEATHAHALVHRREAVHVGEFGTGWHNSAFWYGQAGNTERMELLRRKARELAAENGYPEWQRWAEATLLVTWQPKALNGLLNDAIVDTSRRGAPAANIPGSLGHLASVLATLELTMLLDDCLERCCVPSS